MKMQLKRWLASLLATTMTIGCLGSGTSVKSYAAETDTLQNDDIVAMEESSKEYAIYPIPQNVTYEEGELNLTSTVNIVSDQGVDEATLNYVKEVL